MTSRKDDERWEAWVMEALRARHLNAPSAGALRKATALGGRLPSRSAGALQWLAELVFDSAARPLPVGVRSSAGGQRRLLYEARAGETEERMQLDLRVRREPAGTLELTGQLLPPWVQARVEATVGRTKRKKTLGESGEFLMRGIPARASAVRLEIRGENGEQLVVDELPLLPQPSEPS